MGDLRKCFPPQRKFQYRYCAGIPMGYAATVIRHNYTHNNETALLYNLLYN